MTAGDVEGALADLRRRLDDLTAQTVAAQTAAAAGTAQQLESLRARVGRLETLPGELERMAEAATTGHQATVETLRRVIEELARNTESLQQATLATVRAEMGRMGDAVGERLGALESLPGDVQGLHRELDRAIELTTGRDAELSRLLRRAGPLEEAVAALRADVERARAETTAARSAMAAAAERMDGLAARLTEVEPVQLDVANLRRELERVAEEVGVARQAALSAAGEQLSVQARLRSLEPLPATVESLQREIVRLSKESGAARQAALTLLGERVAPLEDALEDARHDLDDLSATAAAGAERLGAVEERLAALESLPADVHGLYRELDKVAEVTTTRAAEVARAVGPTGMLRGEIDLLRAEVARMSEDAVTQGRIDSLSSRLEGLEAVRGEVAALAHDVERVVQRSSAHDVALAQVGKRTTPVEAAVDDLRRRLDRLGEQSVDHARLLDALPAEVEAVRRELQDLAAEASRRSTPIEATVDELRHRLDRVAEETALPRGDVLTAAEERISSLALRIRQLEALPSEVERLSGALDGLAEGLRDTARTAVSAAAERTAPIEAAVEGLRGDLRRVAIDVLAVQRASQAPAVFQLKALEKQVAGLARRLSGDASIEGGMSTVAAQLADLEAKVRALEGVPADIEGVYAALYRVAEEVKTARRDAALA